MPVSLRYSPGLRDLGGIPHDLCGLTLHIWEAFACRLFGVTSLYFLIVPAEIGMLDPEGDGFVAGRTMRGRFPLALNSTTA